MVVLVVFVLVDDENVIVDFVWVEVVMNGGGIVLLLGLVKFCGEGV